VLDNAGLITAELLNLATSMNNGDGALSKLVSDKEIGNSVDNIVTNLETSASEFKTLLQV
jgi:phospholipid/cholesterol/gamma-HCH transport system substrate-binding protein